jgi:hypothetical protein
MTYYIIIHSQLVIFLRDNVTETSISTITNSKLKRCFNMSIYRRLCHASFSLDLKYLSQMTQMKKEKNLNANIVKWYNKSEDDLIWMISCMFQNMMTFFISADKEWLADYLIKLTSKFSTLLIIMKKVIVKEKSQLLMFVDFLMSQHTAKGYFQILDFQVITLRADMST